MAKEKHLLFSTAQGKVKKTALEEYSKIRRSGLIAIKLAEDDELLKVRPTSGKDEVLLITTQAKSIRFSEEDIRPTGRATMGVKGISLQEKDRVVSMETISEINQEAHLLVVTEEGYGKRTALEEYSTQGRGGQGIYTAKIKDKTGGVVDAYLLGQGEEAEEEKDLLIVSQNGKIIRLPLKEVPVMGRYTQGVRLIRLEKGDKVASLTLL